MPEVKHSPATPDRSLSRSRCSLMTAILKSNLRAPDTPVRSDFREFAANKQEER